MRAFDDIEKEIETSRIKELKKFYKQKEDLNKRESDRDTATRYIEYIENELEHLNLITHMKIAHDVNKLINDIKNEMLKDKKISLKILEEARESLDIPIEEIEKLTNENPYNKNFGDKLRQRVNSFYSTSMPMAEDLEQIERNFYEMGLKDNYERDIAYINFVEARMASGDLYSAVFIDEFLPHSLYMQTKQRVFSQTKQLKKKQ
jgi:hypothetical protein